MEREGAEVGGAGASVVGTKVGKDGCIVGMTVGREGAIEGAIVGESVRPYTRVPVIVKVPEQYTPL